MTSVTVISKIIAIFLVFCLTKAAAGSCLSYGHSCWGGHGKRSGMPRHPIVPPITQRHTTEWYLSKLLKPSHENPSDLTALFRNQKQDAGTLEKLNQYGYQIYPLDVVEKTSPSDDHGDGDAESEVEEWGPDTNESESEVVVMAPEDQVIPNSKLRLFQIMNQEAVRKQAAG